MSERWADAAASGRPGFVYGGTRKERVQNEAKPPAMRSTAWRRANGWPDERCSGCHTGCADCEGYNIKEVERDG